MREYDKDLKERLYKVARRFKSNRYTADDFVQEMLLDGRVLACPDCEVEIKAHNRCLRVLGKHRRSEATTEEIREKSDRERQAAATPTSMDDLKPEELEQLFFTDKGALELENKEVVNILLKSLKSPCLLVLDGYYYKGETLSAIAKSMGVTKQRAQQLHDEALQTIRNSKLIKDIQ